MKKYETPILNLTALDSTDVIATSVNLNVVERADDVLDYNEIFGIS